MLPLILVAAAAGAAHVQAHGSDDWDWSRTHTWVMFNIRGQRMTPYQAEFMATHYDIVGIGGTFDGGPHSGEVEQAAAAKQLKQYNDKVKVLIYRNSNLVIDGELQSDLEFDSHPEWILQNATGAPVYNSPTSTSSPFINFTNPAAREWWVSSTIRAITEQPNGTAIDGVYADGAGVFEVLGRGLAPGR
jgi:hypothetical protein